MNAKVGMRFNFLSETQTGIKKIPLTVYECTSVFAFCENKSQNFTTKINLKMFSKLVKKEMIIS